MRLRAVDTLAKGNKNLTKGRQRRKQEGWEQFVIYSVDSNSFRLNCVLFKALLGKLKGEYKC